MTSEVGAGAEGNAGTITVDAASLSLRDNAQIRALTSGRGDGGNLHIQVGDTLSIEGGRGGFSGLSSRVDSGAEGNAGTIAIRAGSFSLRDFAFVDSLTSGQGNGGNLSIHVKDAFSIEGGRNGASGLSSQVDTRAEGNAGTISIHTGSLSIGNNAGISSSTSGRGNGGNLSIHVGNTFSVEGGRNGESRVSSVVSPGAIGNAGTITIHADSLSLRNRAQIRSSAAGQGNAGDIGIRVSDRFSIEGDTFRDSRGNRTSDGIYSETSRGGLNAGNISIDAGSLVFNGRATVSSLTNSSRARVGGNIQINADTIHLSDTSAIITSVQRGEAQAGDISINTNDFLVLQDGSDILATANQGQGGRINIVAPIFFASGYNPANPSNQGISTADVDRLRRNNQVDISATSQASTPGTVDISTRLIFSESALTPVAVTLTPPEQVIAGSCLARRNVAQDRFVVTGSGGLPPTPDEWLSSPYELTQVRPLSGEAIAPSSPVPQASGWQLGDPIDEAQGLYATADGHLLLSMAAPESAIAPPQAAVCDR
ncbi:MAG TPA: hypothetical protein V6C78_10660 [Crinalium sp.]